MKSNTSSNRHPHSYPRKRLLCVVVVSCISVFSISVLTMNSRATVASENSNTEVFDSLTHSFDRSLNREASAHAAPATRQAESVGTLIRNMLLNQHYRHR